MTNRCGVDDLYSRDSARSTPRTANWFQQELWRLLDSYLTSVSARVFEGESYGLEAEEERNVGGMVYSVGRGRGLD